MKNEVDKLLERHGVDTPPPPAQVFTIANKPGDGNMHFVQKVFQGAFEVINAVVSDFVASILTLSSLISCFLLALLLNL